MAGEVVGKMVLPPLWLPLNLHACRKENTKHGGTDQLIRSTEVRWETLGDIDDISGNIWLNVVYIRRGVDVPLLAAQ